MVGQSLPGENFIPNQNDDMAGWTRGTGMKTVMLAEEGGRWTETGRAWEEAELKDTCSQGRRRFISYIQEVT
jgi:hypothetical protein